MQLDQTRLYGFKTLDRSAWQQMTRQTLDDSLGSRLTKVGGKPTSPALAEFVGHRLGSRVGIKSNR